MLHYIRALGASGSLPDCTDIRDEFISLLIDVVLSVSFQNGSPAPVTIPSTSWKILLKHDTSVYLS